MTKLVDFKCQYADYKGITPEYAQSLGLKLPELYLKAEDMATLARVIKEERDSTFCKLPVDNCVEAENLGAVIRYDDSPLGPRKDKDILNDTEEVLNLPQMDPGKGRMAEILKACRLLTEEGETVALGVRGLFDILNSLMDIQKVFMTAAMKPDAMKQICDKIRKDLIIYFLAAEESGCRLFFYSDSTGGLNIIGPRYGKKIVEWFTLPLFKELEQVLSEDSLVHLCPKIAFMLTGSGKAAWAREENIDNKDFLDAYRANPKIRFTGQRCNRHLNDKAGKRVYHLDFK